jgi:predicted secreted hydrolase
MHRRGVGLLPALLAVLAPLVFGACGGAGATPIPTPTPSPAATAIPTEAPSEPLKLPEDEGAHDAGIEWWYFNGHLADGAGGRYSFHFVTFQSPAGPEATAQLIQLSWGDHTKKLYLTEEKAGLTAPVRSSGRFDVRNDGWSMRGDGVEYTLSFDTGGDTGAYSVELAATSRKPAALHQGTGLVGLGPAGYTYYYSRTRLDATGVLEIDGQPNEVTGAAWMDHQWGDISGQQVGWDWMSLQFDDGSELMAALVWDPNGRQRFAAYGTHVAPDGTVRHLEGEDLRLTPKGSWTSPATGVVYPMGWEFSVGSLKLDLALIPTQQDAEFAGSRFVPAAYWEGAVSVEGTSAGTAVTGRGFVELVGYDPQQVVPSLPPG